MKNLAFFADMHTHSSNSHDAKSTLSEMCEKYIENRCPMFAVTDHFDGVGCDRYDYITPIKNSSDDVDSCRKIYGDKVKILKGVEIGEYIYSPKEALEVAALCDYDVIIGSQHFFYFEGTPVTHSVFDFSFMSEKEIYEIFSQYFDDILKLINDRAFKFDILAHITYPARYINGKFARSEDIHVYDDKIREILKTAINRDIALEVNTSNLKTDYPFLMPDQKILKMYRELGGKLLTVGSDAHSSDVIICGFYKTFELLRETGFKELYYFKNRKPFAYEIPEQ